jgi:hypothetical protein
MSRLPLSLLSAALFPALLAATARAETVTHVASIETVRALTTASVELPRFDRALGTLDEVKLDLQVQTTGGVGFESLSTRTDVVTTTFGTVCELKAEGGATLATAGSLLEATRVYAPYDGKIDFAGESGTLDLGLKAEATGSYQTTGDGYWVSGIEAQSPTVELDLVLTSLTGVDAGGPHVLRHGQTSEVGVMVTYTYTPPAD